MPEKEAHMDNLARAAQALSDETRLRILNLLTVKECCVCEVMQALDITQTRASRNLKILDDAGFLNLRTDGLFSLYSLGKACADGFHADLLKAVKTAMRVNEAAQKDVQRLKGSRRVGPGCSPAACEAA
jgi:ArsR family transcriptional regulator